MSNQFLNHLNSITPQGRAKDTSIFVPAKDLNEAVPDVGQNIRGMPKKAGRKFAQALHNLAQDRGSLEDYQAARERYTKKKASNAQRQGRNLDRAVQSFKKRMRMDEAPKYAQDAIPAVPELLMLTYSNKHKRDADGLKKFVGKSKKNPMPVYEGAVKASMEDWLYDLPKGAVRELKAKHGKHLAQTGMGGKDPKGLDSSVHGILQKHNVPPLMGSHRNSVDAVKMSFHTFHGDLHEQKEVDDEGGMAMGELKSIIANANDIMSMLKSDSQLEGWVQSKITKSADYISSVKDYLSNTPNSISEEEEKRESTKSMIARLVARGHKKIGKPIPKNVLRDIEKEHKNEDDDYEDD